MPIDPEQSPLDNILAMVNEANARSLDSTQVSCGAPVALDPAANGGNNTSITLTAINGSGYVGTKDVTYNRLVPNVGASRNGVASVSSIPITLQSTPASVFNDLVALGNLIGSDIALVTTSFDASLSALVVDALDGSLVYVGRGYIACHWVEIDLASAVQQTDLPGFE